MKDQIRIEFKTCDCDNFPDCGHPTETKTIDTRPPIPPRMSNEEAEDLLKKIISDFRGF